MPKVPRDPSNPAYQFIPRELKDALPRLYSKENQTDPIVYLKFFTPDSSWTWYLTEYSPEERLCFGLVVGDDRELGYFSLDELEDVRGPMGLPIERDLSWQPMPLSQCR